MFKKTQLAVYMALLLSSAGVYAAENGLWQDVERSQLHQAARSGAVLPKKFRLLTLDQLQLHSQLNTVPSERQQALRTSQRLITLPLPEGGEQTFRVVETSVMAAELAAKYPQLKTYQGEAVDNPAVTVRFDWTEAGFHAMVFTSKGVVYVDPYQQGDTLHYMSYYKHDGQTVPRNQTTSDFIKRSGSQLRERTAERVAARSSGDTLRTYRIAVATTGEYTQFFGGTVAKGLSAVVTAINRVSGIYEKEISVRLQLVANNDELIYTNGATDPYSDGFDSALLSENQPNVDKVIGSANYDIGHVFSTDSGKASVGVVCDNRYKAEGTTGSSNPTGDAFWVDYVAHEIGHQFGGNHTFNSTHGSCAGRDEPGANYEIGSGSTIMGYAGICNADDLQPHTDPYFHSHSFDEITTYLSTTTGNSCGTKTASGNSAPVVNPGASGLVIPKQTPIMLTGSATDTNGDALTYSWEEYDLGDPTSLASTKLLNTPTGNLGTVPLFRVFPPVASSSRYLPQYAKTFSNTSSNVELLPNYARQLNFRLTARDNKGGVTVSAVKKMSVTDLAGPFTVSYPEAVSWEAGTNNGIVRWNVAKTNLAPVNCSAVNISLDAGSKTFALIKNTPNDGMEIVNIPAIATTAGRIKVSCSNNVFFDLSNSNITVTKPTAAHLNLQAAYGAQTGDTIGAVFCAAPATAQNAILAVGSVASFANPVTLSYLNLPAGFTGNFLVNGVANNTVNSPYSKNVKASFSFPATVANQAYKFQIQGSATGTASASVNVELGIATTVLSLPAPASSVTTLKPTLSWLPVTGAQSYTVEVATDSAFTNKVVNASVIGTQYTLTTNLTGNTTYYWRVLTVNGCGKGITTTSVTHTFSTPTTVCSTPKKTGSALIRDTIAINGTQPIKDLNVLVNLTHAYIGDVNMSLTHVATGKKVQLMPNLSSASGGSCKSANLLTTFDDESTAVLTCTNTIGGGTRKSSGLLSGFDGEALGGQWRIDINDTDSSVDDGTLQQWCLYPTL